MIVIIDYDAGNLRSVQRACEKVGMASEISSDPERVLHAEKIIFPGVGSAESAVETLKKRGLDNFILKRVKEGMPILGICLGMQLFFDSSDEAKDVDGLGIIKGKCSEIKECEHFKVPHIGWNELEIVQDHPILRSVQNKDEFYFVHSYFARPQSEEHVFGRTNYGDVEFASVIGRENFFSTQFHLEKSGELGLRLLAAFSSWNGD